jgi:uncharacterized protein (TIGR03086 family)
MSEPADRYRRVAADFTRVAAAVSSDAWDAPVPCDGWVARDIVTHMVEWFPGVILEPAGVKVRPGPSAHDDPVGAWTALDSVIRDALDDPEVAARVMQSPTGPMSFEQALDTFATGDVLVHTWDLARATGQDDTLDAEAVHTQWVGFQHFPEELLRNSGHYGPRVEVPDDADEQTKLIAYTGRQP